MKNRIIPFIFLLIIFSCDLQKKSADDTALMDEVAETYYANLPCADCEALKYKLTLNSEGGFEEEMIYSGKSNEPFTKSGTYSISDSIVILEKEQPGHDQFAVLPEGRLMMLDVNGARIETELEEAYVLTQKKPAELKPESGRLLHDIWALDSLNGRDVSFTDLPKGLPTLEIFFDDQRIVGFAGCNDFSGAVIIGEDSLSFSQVVSTKMSCPADEVESQYLAALSSGPYRYHIENLRLYLSGANYNLIFKKVD